MKVTKDNKTVTITMDKALDWYYYDRGDLKKMALSIYTEDELNAESDRRQKELVEKFKEHYPIGNVVYMKNGSAPVLIASEPIPPSGVYTSWRFRGYNIDIDNGKLGSERPVIIPSWIVELPSRHCEKKVIKQVKDGYLTYEVTRDEWVEENKKYYTSSIASIRAEIHVVEENLNKLKERKDKYIKYKENLDDIDNLIEKIKKEMS